MLVEKYHLTLDLTHDETFSASIVITAMFDGEKKIAFDSVGLNYHTVTFNNVPLTYSSQPEKVIFHMPDSVYSEASIYVEYTGKINHQMEGLYKTFYDKEQFAYGTQMESEECRKLFPCIDVPKEKACIQLSLKVLPNWYAFSNTDIEETVENESFTLYHFQMTDAMSTYLFALYTVPKHLINYVTFSEKNPRVAAILPKGKTAKLAGDATVRGVSAMSTELNYPFPLAKIDIAALPDFSSGAMENWGLITFRDIYILDDPGNTKVLNMRIQEVVLHELGHQWFGNLVTLEKWTSLWMKEGFATWLAYYFGNKLYPDANFSRKFVESEIEAALWDDYLDGTHPLESDDANLNEIYDSLTYSKGATLIHVLYHLIGEENMMAGLSDYVNKYAYRSTNPPDLIRCLVGNTPLFESVNKFVTTTKYAICTVKNSAITADRELIFPYLEVNNTIENFTVKVKPGDIVNGHRKNYTRVKYAPEYLNALLERLPTLDQIEISVLWSDMVFFVYHGHYHISILLSNIKGFYIVADDDNKKLLRGTLLNFYYLSEKEEWKKKWRQLLFTVSDSLLLQRMGIQRTEDLETDSESRYDTFAAYASFSENPLELWNMYSTTDSLSIQKDIRFALTRVHSQYAHDVIRIALSDDIRDQDRHSMLQNLAFNPDLDYQKLIIPYMTRILEIYPPTSKILNYLIETWAHKCPPLLFCLSEDIKEKNNAAIARGTASKEKDQATFKAIETYFGL
jgi:hypothetical protein